MYDVIERTVASRPPIIKYHVPYAWCCLCFSARLRRCLSSFFLCTTFCYLYIYILLLVFKIYIFCFHKTSSVRSVFHSQFYSSPISFRANPERVRRLNSFYQCVWLYFLCWLLIVEWWNFDCRFFLSRNRYCWVEFSGCKLIWQLVSPLKNSFRNREAHARLSLAIWLWLITSML